LEPLSAILSANQKSENGHFAFPIGQNLLASSQGDGLQKAEDLDKFMILSDSSFCSSEQGLWSTRGHVSVRQELSSVVLWWTGHSSGMGRPATIKGAT
jgi:hypothetical protein